MEIKKHRKKHTNKRKKKTMYLLLADRPVNRTGSPQGCKGKQRKGKRNKERDERRTECIA